MHIFDYTRTKYQLNDFDLANCNADIKRTFFIFNLRSKKELSLKLAIHMNTY